MSYSGSASAVVTFPVVSSPTRLRLPDLLHTTDRFADEVLRGCFNPTRSPDLSHTAGSDGHEQLVAAERVSWTELGDVFWACHGFLDNYES